MGVQSNPTHNVGRTSIQDTAASSHAAQAGLENDLALQVKTLSRLHDLAIRLATSVEPRPALQAILETLVEAHRADFGLLSLYDPSSECLLHAARVGIDEAALALVAKIAPGPEQGACDSAFATKERVVIEDVETDPRCASYREFAQAVGFRAEHSTPIWRRSGELVGVISVHFKSSRRPSDGEIQLAELCARHAADAIDAAKSRQALRESEERFSRFMQHLPGLAWIKDISGRYVFANEAAQKAFRTPPAELYGKTDLEVFAKDTAMQFHANDQQALASDSGIQTVETLEHGDGTLHYSLVSKFPIPGADGAPTLIGGMAIDVTDRRRTEESLRESEQRFRTLASHAPVGIFQTGPDGECTFVNERWCAMAGVTADEARGQGWIRALHPEDRDRVVAGWNDAVRRGVASEAEFRFLRPDGVVTWIQGNAVPLQNENGQLIGYIGTSADVTQRKLAEIALRESEKRFRHMADHAPVMIWVTEADGNCSFLGKTWYEFTGRTPETSLGFGWIDAVHADDRATARDMFLAANDRHEEFHLEYRLLDKNGSYHWIIDAGVPRFGEDGRFLGFIGSVIDISKRKKAEESLRATREQLQLVTDIMATAVTRCTADHRYVWVNPGYAALLGKAPDEIAGRHISEVIGDSAYATIRPYIERVLAGAKVDYEALVNYQGIGERWIRGAYVPTYGNATSPDGWVGVIVDVSGEKRKADALRTSEQVYRAIGESNDYGVWVCEPDGRNVYVSESFLRLVGLTQEQCSNFGWGDVLHPDDSERTLAAWKECVRTGGTWDIEHRFRGVDGKWHPILARGVPVRNERGEITAWAGINLDISRLKQVENELREADRRKDEFLAMLAHELRNPLAPIRTGLELMRLAGDDRAVIEEVRTTMDRQSQQMVRLIDDLLDVNRITRGTVELRKCRVELASVVESAVETARPVIEELGHRLNIAVPKSPVVLDADPTRLAQVISNLLNNAAKYMKRGGNIDLAAQRHGNLAVISIKDSGIGIPADMIDRIFELFIQVDGSLERSHGGLGIGLTLVKRLVEMHGGTVEAHSAGSGQGSEFIVRLPVVVGLLNPPHETNGQSAAASGKRRIMVVDDNENAARMLGMLLEALGNDVRTAFDGLTAIELAGQFRPDVMLLDIGMPKLDGYETARRIREKSWGQHMVLAALTGWGQEEDKRRTRAAGFDHHFVKPVEPAVLQKFLAECESSMLD